VRKYWLLDQHGEDGPTALVETDGSMHIVRILRFGPGITELAAQQEIQDRVIGKVAPTMKPLVDGSSIAVEGVEPHADLRQSSKSGSTKTNRADRRSAARGGSPGGRTGGGPRRAGGSGDR
jgi:hypothetical protein